METPLPGPQQNIDNEHLRLLALFHYIVAGIAALFACFPIIHLVLGLVLILAPQKLASANQQPPALVGWILVAMASCFILAGWTVAILILLAGRRLAHRKKYTFCFVMAAVECLFCPFGTV